MNRAERTAYAAALAALLLAGVLFRSWGVVIGETLDFWADEAWWAELMARVSLAEFSLRPVGYVWLSQRLVAFGDPELVLRLPSYVAALGTLAFTTASAHRLFASRVVVLLVVCLVALHPKLIAFAKEFKPYAVEAFVYSAFIYYGLVGRARAAVWVGALAALPFAYNVVFLYPGLAAATLPRWLRERPLASLLCLAAACVVVALAAIQIHAALDLGARHAIWGDKYGVFPPPGGTTDTVRWYARATWNLLRFPAALPTPHASLSAPLASVCAAVAVFGAWMLARRRRFALLLLLVGPVAFAGVANAFEFWPYGAFRTNLFMIPPLALLVGVGMQALMAWSPLRGVVSAAALAAIAVWVVASPGQHRMKQAADWAPAPQLTQALSAMQSRLRADAEPAANVIIADWHSWRVFHYYLDFDARASYADLRAAASLVRGPVTGRAALIALLSDAHREAQARDGVTRVWLVITKLDRFAPVLDDPLVREFAVHRQAFATHDADYHPVLVELRIPGR